VDDFDQTNAGKRNTDKMQIAKRIIALNQLKTLASFSYMKNNMCACVYWPLVN